MTRTAAIPAPSLPQSWSSSRLKYLAGVNEHKLPNDSPPDLQLKYIDISAVDRLGVHEAPQELSFEEAPTRARRLARPGDVAISTVRTYLRAVAQVGSETADCVWSTGFSIITPRSLHPRFLYYVIVSTPFIEDVVARSVGVSYPAVNPEDIMDIEVPVPPDATQVAVAEYLDLQTERIDSLIGNVRTQPERGRQEVGLFDALSQTLWERRQALITAAVTGQLDIAGSG